MSLLMDALKKAEQAKQSADAPPEPAGELRLEPIDASIIDPAAVGSRQPAAAPPPQTRANNDGKQLPELPARLEMLDADFMTPAATPPKRPGTDKAAADPSRPAPASATRTASGTTPSPPPRTVPGNGQPARPAAPGAGEGERKAASQVFSAKQPTDSRKGFAIAMAGLTIVGAGAIGGYFWWQLQPKSGLAHVGLSPPTAPPPARVIPAADATLLPPPRATGTPTAATSAALADDALHGKSRPGAPIALLPARPETPAVGFSRPDEMANAPPITAARRPPARSALPAPAQDPASPLRITRSQLKLDPTLTEAWAALNAGDLAAAQAGYERVLKREPKNSDALHGLAAVALRQGDVARAEDLWLKVLEADPKDATAQAALIGAGGRGGGDAQAQESRLKTLINAQPEIAVLHFALGNVLARQSRWNDAQQSYFKAFTIEPEHPDYLFNLAVSLDQMRQPRLAAQYYHQAVAAAAKRPAGFDKTQAANRARELLP